MSTTCSFILFFFYPSSSHRYLHSFPTRRSSDLFQIIQRLHVVVAGAKDFGDGQIDSRACRSRRRGDIQFLDRKSTRLNSSYLGISYAVFCLKKKKKRKKIYYN